MHPNSWSSTSKHPPWIAACGHKAFSLSTEFSLWNEGNKFSLSSSTIFCRSKHPPCIAACVYKAFSLSIENILIMNGTYSPYHRQIFSSADQNTRHESTSACRMHSRYRWKQTFSLWMEHILVVVIKRSAMNRRLRSEVILVIDRRHSRYWQYILSAHQNTRREPQPTHTRHSRQKFETFSLWIENILIVDTRHSDCGQKPFSLWIEDILIMNKRHSPCG